MRQAFGFVLLGIVAAQLCGQESKPSSEESRKTAAAAVPPAEGEAARVAHAPESKRQEPSPPTDKGYLIGPEDVLLISVWGDQRLTGNYIVRPDGYISMNLIRDVKAADRTPDQLRQDITERLQAGDFLKSPEINVQVQQVNSKKIFIQGEVNKPGAFSLVVPTNVMQALVNAGGFRDFANQKNIIIQRGTQRFKFNFKEVTAGKNLEQNIWLEPGDHIIVK
jgi:polysaccharide biosynthesis/export protein